MAKVGEPAGRNNLMEQRDRVITSFCHAVALSEGGSSKSDDGGGHIYLGSLRAGSARDDSGVSHPPIGSVLSPLTGSESSFDKLRTVSLSNREQVEEKSKKKGPPKGP